MLDPELDELRILPDEQPISYGQFSNWEFRDRKGWYGQLGLPARCRSHLTQRPTMCHPDTGIFYRQQKAPDCTLGDC